jgi:hypothetical protein
MKTSLTAVQWQNVVVQVAGLAGILTYAHKLYTNCIRAIHMSKVKLFLYRPR